MPEAIASVDGIRFLLGLDEAVAREAELLVEVVGLVVELPVIGVVEFGVRKFRGIRVRAAAAAGRLREDRVRVRSATKEISAQPVDSNCIRYCIRHMNANG